MKKEIPGILWVAIISLSVMIFGKLVLTPKMPLLVVDALLCGVLLVGIVRGQKWAFIFVFAFAAGKTVLGLSQGVGQAIAILAVDSFVLVPVWICRDYFLGNYNQMEEEALDGGTSNSYSGRFHNP